MKKVILIFLFGLTILSSCDPDVPGEGIDLPQMNLPIKISPDTSYLKIGDALTISASISSTLDNGVKITDGNAMIDLFFGYCSETPVTTLNFTGAINNDHFKIVEIEKGGINISTTSNKVKELYASSYEDSVQLEISIIPLKIGTYVFQTQSLFFEGSQGKTRTNPKFKVTDNNWWFWENIGIEIPTDETHFKSYFFAVYE